MARAGVCRGVLSRLVGAVHQAPFVALCVLTALLYVASLALERWMRSQNRIPGLIRRRERVWDTAAIVCAVIAALFLIMLSAFNDIDHPKVRRLSVPAS